MTSERGFIWLGLTYDPASGTSAYLSDGRDASTDLVLAPLGRQGVLRGGGGDRGGRTAGQGVRKRVRVRLSEGISALKCI